MKKTTNEEQEQINKFKENERNNKRIYRDQIRQVNHDLYKLEVASMKQDKGIEGRSKNFVDVEHCHFYHSVDSRGTKQEYASSIGGHTHKITTSQDENGNLVGNCGPSVIVQGGKTYSLKHPESVHTHDVTYLGSDILEILPVNKEASKVLGIK